MCGLGPSRRGTMKISMLEGATRLGAAAVTALTILLPADTTQRAAPAGRELARERKFDKRYMDKESAFNPKRRTVTANRGEPDGEDEAGESGITPLSAAEEKFARRAYPTGVIPAAATRAAQDTWKNFVENKDGSHYGNNPNQPLFWDMIGPTHATQPGILSFSGAQYHMSGRITALAITPTCTNSRCRLWVGAAGGGIWRTDNPLSPDPYWVFVSDSFSSNAIGTIDQDPADRTGNTLFAGTGEPNASGDSESGVGIYRTTDGGDTWTLLPGSKLFATRSISKVVVDPTNSNHLYAGVARGVRGYASVTGGTFSRTGACIQFPTVLSCQDGPDQAPLGLFESFDGGVTFVLAWDGAGSIRGVNDVGLDPADPSTVYAAAFQSGIWRRSVAADGSPTFKQVFRTTSPAENTSRTQFDLTTVPGTGAQSGTRIYVIDGSTGNPPSQVWRADGANLINAAALLASEAAHAAAPSPNTGPGWALKSQLTSRPASGPYRPAYNPCTGQCWYDADVYSPKGFPDIVYLLGSYQYTELRERSNGRGVMISLTAGDPDPTTAAPAQVPTFNPGPPASIGPPFTTDVTGGNFTDLTWDDTLAGQPDQTHPDQHAIITPEGQPFLFFEGSDGGLVRSDGTFDNASADCLKYHANDADTLVHCMRVLSRVPHQLYDTLNKGLSTLQFQSVSLNPKRPLHDLQGGTQDNGTFDWDSQLTTWYEEIYGDGGQSGYNYCDDKIRFNTFFGYYTDENFHAGQYDKWLVTSGPLSQLNNGEAQSFYIPIVSDYTNCGPLTSSRFSGFRTEAARVANTNQTTTAQNSGGGQIGASLGFQYAGLQHVWRTIDNGGPEASLESCPEFTTSGDDPRCGDWQPLGDPAYTGPGHRTPGEPGDLTSQNYGADRLLGTVAAVERNPGNDNELWAATSFGRVFVSFNVNNVDPKTVTFCRLDNLAVATPPNLVAPPRFVSSIYPDPANPNRAWLSYDGYTSNTKDQPGHVFEVTFTGPATSGSPCPTAAVWRDLHVEGASATHSDPAGDIPITDLVR